MGVDADHEGMEGPIWRSEARCATVAVAEKQSISSNASVVVQKLLACAGCMLLQLEDFCS